MPVPFLTCLTIQCRMEVVIPVNTARSTCLFPLLSFWLWEPEAFTPPLILHADYFPLIIADIHSTLAEKDKDYFRTSREEMFGAKLEDLQLGREVWC